MVDGRSNTGESMSLLQNVIEHPLDDDYYAVDPSTRTGSTTTRLATIVALAVFAVLVTVSAVQTRTSRPAAESERAGLIAQIDSRKTQVRTKQTAVSKLADEVAGLQRTRSDPAAAVRLLAQRVVTGAVAVRGPGLAIVVDNATNAEDKAAGRVQDKDLQLLVNGLWGAGAEAVAVNGSRLSTLSSIRTAGEAITVNYKSLSRPYRVSAIGDPKTLQARFLDTAGGQAWNGLRTNLGMRFEVTSKDSILLPAAPRKRVSLLEASALGTSS